MTRWPAAALNHVNSVFRPFFARGGAILAVTGNHDQDARIDLVRAGMSLVTMPTAAGGELAPGRMYLLNRCFYGSIRAAAGDSGPLDRLDFGEREDDRGVWLVDVGPTGLHAEPQWLPLEPTPMLRWVFAGPIGILHPDLLGVPKANRTILS